MKTKQNNKVEAKAVEAKSVAVEVIRAPERVLPFIKYDDKGRAAFEAGSNVKPDELVGVLVQGNDQFATLGVRQINTLRLARQLPDKEVVEGGGEKALTRTTVKAFEYVAARVKERCSTPSAWSQILGMVPCADLVDELNLECSPFAVKEALAYLRKMGFIGDDYKPTEALKDALKKKEGADPVALALKNGTGVNKIRPVIAEAKVKANEVAKASSQPLPFKASKVETVAFVSGVSDSIFIVNEELKRKLFNDSFYFVEFS